MQHARLALVLGILTAVGPLSIDMYLPAFPAIAAEFGGAGTAETTLAAFFVGLAAGQLTQGPVADRFGRRGPLMVGGAVVTALGIAAHVPADSVADLVVARLIVGAGQGALFVGAATLVNDLAPAERRGEAASIFSVAIYVGLGFGPFLGEWILGRASFDAVWWTAAAGLVVSAAIGLLAPVGLPVTHDEPAAPLTGMARLLHPAAVGPGTVLLLGVVGFVGFNTFMPLHGEEIGLDDVAAVFLLFAFVVLTVRLLGSRLPDQHGPVVIGTVALGASAIGLLGIAAWLDPVGLYLFTIPLAIGSALLYPALMAAAVNNAPDNERSSAVATFTMFFELATALGGALLGVVASLTSYSGAFVAAACCALVGLAVLRLSLGPRLAARAVA